MKGTPEHPECGFSRAVVQILDMQGIPPQKLKTYNVLADPELRTGIKEFSCVFLVALPRRGVDLHMTCDPGNGRQYHRSTLTANSSADATLSYQVSSGLLVATGVHGLYNYMKLTILFLRSASIRRTRNPPRNQRCASQRAFDGVINTIFRIDPTAPLIIPLPTDLDI